MTVAPFSHEYFMNLALKEAQKAFDDDEVPIGAVVVHDNKVIAKAYNQVQRLQDATAHAEMIAITSASAYLNSKYLNECSIYVSVEPCLMCYGAILTARISSLVVGCREPKTGFSLYQMKSMAKHPQLIYDVEGDRAELLMKQFFERKREGDK